jgi:hypothetical protein
MPKGSFGRDPRRPVLLALLVEARMTAELTQAELAEAAGVSQPTCRRSRAHSFGSMARSWSTGCMSAGRTLAGLAGRWRSAWTQPAIDRRESGADLRHSGTCRFDASSNPR